MSVTAASAIIPISEKYVSITPPLSPEKNTFLGNINNALSVIAANSIHDSKTRDLQQKMSRILCDWDFNYTENKPILIELWHFFNSVEKKHIEFCDKRGCPYQCDCHSISTNQRLLLDAWWGSFKMLVKDINDRVDNNIILCVKPQSVNSMNDHIYFVLTDIYLNLENHSQYESLFTDIFYRLISEQNETGQNETGQNETGQNETLSMVVDLLHAIDVHDFKFVHTGTKTESEEYKIIDFYTWWSAFTVFRKNISKRCVSQKTYTL